jgi:hypothetical protein
MRFCCRDVLLCNVDLLGYVFSYLLNSSTLIVKTIYQTVTELGSINLLLLVCC